jgi:outer membrane protein
VQYIISTNDLERKISSNVLIAINKLKNSLSELDRAHEALISYQSAVENEKKKFDFGISTLLDLISMEERLTTSLLNEISAQVTVANALAGLNFETGNLITSDGKFGSVRIEDLVSF